MPELLLQSIYLSLGRSSRRTEVFRDFSLTINSKRTALMGPSGSGKTTFLRLVAGLIQPWKGTVWMRGKPLTGPGIDRPLVFQQSAIFPWMSVYRNVEFGLQKNSQHEIEDMLDKLGILPLATRMPKELSGGQLKRVELARALAVKPSMLLLDEGFSSLDEPLRVDLQQAVLRSSIDSDTAILVSTHDIEEAILLSDELILLSGPPLRILDRIPVDFDKSNVRELRQSVEFQTLRHRILTIFEDARPST